MPMLTKPSGAPGTSLAYITIGAILSIWATVWYTQAPPSSPFSKIICLGLLMTGLALLAIGMMVGYISRTARKAELPPTEAVSQVARESQAEAAAQQPIGAAPVPVQPMPTATRVVQV